MAEERGLGGKVWFVIAEVIMPIISLILVPSVIWLGATLLSFDRTTRDNANSIKANTTAMDVLDDKLGAAKTLAGDAYQILQSHLSDERASAVQFQQMQKTQDEMRSDQKEMKKTLDEIRVMLIRQHDNVQ